MSKNFYHFFTLTLFFGVLAANAQKQPEITADQPIEINQTGTELIAKGHAQIVQDKFFLEADQVAFSKDGGGGAADGNVQVGIPPARFVMDKLEYRLDNRNLSADNFRLAAAPIFMGGSRIGGNAQQIEIKNTTVYWQEPDAVSPNLYVENAIYYTEQERVIAHNAWLKIGRVPFFYLPYLNVRTFERPFSFDGSVGYRTDLGAYVRTESYFSTFPDAQLGVLLDYYTKRGLLAGPAFRHELHNGIWDACGSVETGFINDHGNRGVDILNQPIPESRRFVRVREKAVCSECLDVTAKIDYWSDSYVTRDFRPGWYWDDQQPDNFVEGTYRGEQGYYISLFSRFRPNSFETLVERIPEVSFRLAPTLFGCTGIYQQFDVAAAHLRKQQISGETPLAQANRLDVYYGLYRPIACHDFLTVTPVLGGRMTSYGGIHGAEDPSSTQYNRFLAQVGVDLQLKAYGVSGITIPSLGIQTLRHNVTPIVQYRYIPKANQGHTQIPHLDDTVFTPYPQAIDLGERRDIDHMKGTNVLRFGLQNTWQTRCYAQGMRELATIDLYQDLRFNPVPDDHQWSDFYADINLYPASFLKFRLYGRIETETATLKEVVTSFEIYSGERWSVKVGTSALQHIANQAWVCTHYRLDERNQLRCTIRYDFRRQAFTDQYYSYWFRLGNAWALEPYLARMEYSSREIGWEGGIKVAIIDL